MAALSKFILKASDKRISFFKALKTKDMIWGAGKKSF